MPFIYLKATSLISLSELHIEIALFTINITYISTGAARYIYSNHKTVKMNTYKNILTKESWGVDYPTSSSIEKNILDDNSWDEEIKFSASDLTSSSMKKNILDDNSWDEEIKFSANNLTSSSTEKNILDDNSWDEECVTYGVEKNEGTWDEGNVNNGAVNNSDESSKTNQLNILTEESWDDDNYETYNPTLAILDKLIIRTPPIKKSRSIKKKFREEERKRLNFLLNKKQQ